MEIPETVVSNLELLGDPLMLKSLIVTASSLAMMSFAVAADLPQPQPVPVAPAPVGKAPIGKSPVGKAPVVGKAPFGKAPAPAPAPIITKG
ncbi:hypothetical protein GCM10010994_52970 [Chelatococcus reniformis]|uniref:Uncharacterized protein n=2 Tax=Chelatococcus reniformis TaxID=1494448 RepID=A0A916UVA6_9HYPH|nr:hypothetical protein GCM10010994_52970 [Chelatococcus reniformis]